MPTSSDPIVIVSAFAGNGDRRNLGLERTVLDRLACARQCLDGISILVGARKLIGFHRNFAEIAHRPAALVGIFEAIEHHVVENLVVTDAIAAARLTCCLTQRCRQNPR